MRGLISAVFLLVSVPMTLAAQASAANSPDAASQLLWKQANQSRAALGLKLLAWDPALAQAADLHCGWMTREGELAHRYGGEPDVAGRTAEAGARFALIEENVALASQVQMIHQGWLDSPEHRANLLNPKIDRVGIAVRFARGVYYAVADYAMGVEALTAAQVETRVAATLAAQGLKLMDDPRDARAACALERGLPSTMVRGTPEFVMRWQDSQLVTLPDTLQRRIASRDYDRASVGSCPAQDVNGAFTLYRVTVLLYQRFGQH